eukprot:306833-Chlamydomonas_euryale.AAC.4
MLTCCAAYAVAQRHVQYFLGSSPHPSWNERATQAARHTVHDGGIVTSTHNTVLLTVEACNGYDSVGSSARKKRSTGRRVYVGTANVMTIAARAASQSYR